MQELIAAQYLAAQYLIEVQYLIELAEVHRLEHCQNAAGAATHCSAAEVLRLLLLPAVSSKILCDFRGVLVRVHLRQVHLQVERSSAAGILQLPAVPYRRWSARDPQHRAWFFCSDFCPKHLREGAWEVRQSGAGDLLSLEGPLAPAAGVHSWIGPAPRAEPA